MLLPPTVWQQLSCFTTVHVYSGLGVAVLLYLLVIEIVCLLICLELWDCVQGKYNDVLVHVVPCR